MVDETKRRRILRSQIPVDDEWHARDMGGPIVHVATRDPRVVEIWWLDETSETARPRTFRVFGTGHPLPDAAQYVGTAITPDGSLVWHLMERP